MGLVITTQRAFHPQPPSVSVGKLQARGRVVERKSLTGAPQAAGLLQSWEWSCVTGPGLPVLSLPLQETNLHICHGLELFFTPGSVLNTSQTCVPD